MEEANRLTKNAAAVVESMSSSSGTEAEDGWEVVEAVDGNEDKKEKEEETEAGELQKEPVDGDGEEDYDAYDADAQEGENGYGDEEDEEAENDNSAPAAPIVPIHPSKLGLTMSFKDALASNKRRAPSERTGAPPTQPAATRRRQSDWKSVIKVEKVPNKRIDREYGSRPDMMIDPEDDDVGMSDLIMARMDNKSSVAATRYRSITMLTPAQQAKKDSRIVQKALSK